jgi:hypothetical protein
VDLLDLSTFFHHVDQELLTHCSIIVHSGLVGIFIPHLWKLGVNVVEFATNSW